MGENGQSRNNFGQRIRAGLSETWDSTLRAVRGPERVEEVPMPPKPTGEEIRDAAIRRWAATIPDELMAWFDDKITNAQEARVEALDSPGRLAYHAGIEDAFAAMRKFFVNWRGAKTP